MEMWIILFVSAVGLCILLWGAKILSKTKFTPKDKPKDKPQENKTSTQTQTINMQETSSYTDINIADELRQLINKDEQKKAADEKDSRMSRSSRIRDYHEKRWSRHKNNDEEYDFIDDNQVTITQDDIKKLVAIKDLFDNKPQN